MNENGVLYFTVMTPNVVVMPSTLPWFHNTNLRQHISSPFIKPALSQSMLSRCVVICKFVKVNMQQMGQGGVYHNTYEQSLEENDKVTSYLREYLKLFVVYTILTIKLHLLTNLY